MILVTERMYREWLESDEAIAFYEKFYEIFDKGALDI